MTARGKLALVGLGPGDTSHMSFRAKAAIQEADVVTGYSTYVDLILPLCEGKVVESTAMTQEVLRAKRAADLAEEGRNVAIVCSGDAGIYGMAGLVFEVLRERGWDPAAGPDVEVIPGASAANASAALVGAPLMHDYATISLSDLLTPWDVIERRIRAVAEADFVLALYNPASGRRKDQIARCREILLEHRSPGTPVAIVKAAFRPNQSVIVTTLDLMLEHDLGMLATVIIGNTQTYTYQGYMITPRGYASKYELDGDGTAQVVRPGQRPGRTLAVAPGSAPAPTARPAAGPTTGKEVMP